MIEMHAAAQSSDPRARPLIEANSARVPELAGFRLPQLFKSTPAATSTASSRQRTYYSVNYTGLSSDQDHSTSSDQDHSTSTSKFAFAATCPPQLAAHFAAPTSFVARHHVINLLLTAFVLLSAVQVLLDFSHQCGGPLLFHCAILALAIALYSIEVLQNPICCLFSSVCRAIPLEQFVAQVQEAEPIVTLGVRRLRLRREENEHWTSEEKSGQYENVVYKTARDCSDLLSIPGDAQFAIIDYTITFHANDIDTELSIKDLRDRLGAKAASECCVCEPFDRVSLPRNNLLSPVLTACCKEVPSLGRYLFFSACLLSWPYRVLAQAKIARCHWNVRKLISVHTSHAEQDTPLG